MTTPFDLQGRLSIDYSQLDDLQPEINRRVEGVEGTATVEVDSKRGEAALDHLGAKSKDVRKDLEKPLKVDADTASAARKLDEMRMAWSNKWNYAIDQLSERLSGMQTGESATGVLGGFLTGRTGMILGGMTAFAGASIVGGIVSDTVGAARADALIKKSTEQVFGAAADEYTAQAEKLADSTGYMTNEFLEAQVAINKAALATGMLEAPSEAIQDLQKQLGVRVPATVNPVESLTRVAADIASTTGLPQYAYNISAVTKALASGLQGTSSALLDFNIRLDDTYVLGLAVNKSFKDLGEAITPAQLAQARYNAIMEQTADITGKASETSDDVTQSMMQFDQSMQEAKVAIGNTFLPMVKSLADFIANIPEPLLVAGGWAAFFGGIVMAVGGAVIGLNALRKAIIDLGTAATASAVGVEGKALTTGGGLGGLGSKLGDTLGKIGKSLAPAAGGLGYAGTGTLAAGVAGGAVLALPAAVGAGLLVKYGSNMQKNAESELDMATERYRLNAVRVARLTGASIPSEAAEQAARQGITVNIQLQDQTTKGVQATDAGSQAESNY